MKYIESVKISKFRSIGQNELFNTSELNIISGSNDSGKSNYLKALNLFFTILKTKIKIIYTNKITLLTTSSPIIKKLFLCLYLQGFAPVKVINKFNFYAKHSKC